MSLSVLAVSGWPSGKPATPTPKPRGSGCAQCAVELSNELHQIGGELEFILAAIVVLLIMRRIAAQSHDVGHARGGVSLQNLFDLIARVANGGQVRHGIKPAPGF